MWFEFDVVLSFAPRGFSRSTHFQIPIRLGMVDEEPLRECATSKSLFIIHLSVKIHVSNMKFPFFFWGTKGNSLIGEAVRVELY